MGYRMPTTKQGKGHISSEDDGGLNSAIFGSGNYVVDVGNMFAPTIIDNNTIRLSDGEGIHNGRHFRIPENDYQDITIDNGEMGKKRIDLIVNRYEKTTSTGIESGKFTVIKGTSTTGTPEAPQVIEGNIKSGATESEMPLIEVELDGINIVAVREVFDVIMPMAKINELYTELNSKTLQGTKTTLAEYDATTSIVTKQLSAPISNFKEIIIRAKCTRSDGSAENLYMRLPVSALDDWWFVSNNPNRLYFNFERRDETDAARGWVTPCGDNQMAFHRSGRGIVFYVYGLN